MATPTVPTFDPPGGADEALRKLRSLQQQMRITVVEAAVMASEEQRTPALPVRPPEAPEPGVRSPAKPPRARTRRIGTGPALRGPRADGEYGGASPVVVSVDRQAGADPMIRELWSNFWTLVGGALTLNGQVLLVARDAPRAYLAAVLLGVAAGISLALGQSVVLFANRVSQGRFAFLVLGGGLIFLARLGLWSLCIWLVGVVSPRYALPLGVTFLAVCFGQAPQLFAVFETLPYFGSSLRRVLDAYSLIVVVAGLRWMLDLPVLQAFLAAGLGWLLQAFLGGLLERPLAGVRGWMWRTASGREVFVRSPDVLVELPRDGGAPGTAPTARPGGSGTVQHGE